MTRRGVNGTWSSKFSPLHDPLIRLLILLALLLLQYAVLLNITIHFDPNTVYSNPHRWNTIEDVPPRQLSDSDIADVDSILHQRSTDFSEGSLNVHPTFHRQCVTVRFRGDSNNYTVDDAISMLVQKYTTSPGPRHLRMGIMTLEDPEQFFPIRVRSSGNQYHMFHFVEMLVMAYITLHRLSSALPMHAGKPINVAPMSLTKGSPSLTVPWIFSPHMSPLEICCGANKINCLIADLILQGSNHSIFSDRSGIIGLDAMEHYPFDFTNVRDYAIDHRLELVNRVYGDAPEFADHADGVILVERFGCDLGGINKPWSKFIDVFPSYSWHSDLLYGLGRTWEDHKSPPKRFVLGYIDRQNTDRRLPDEHHDWLLAYLTQHRNIEFRHLQMELYTAVEQIEQASECDMLIGVHGNGLTHSLWMQPRRYVIELFWRFQYQLDYATTAQLMKHSYLGIWNGKAVNTTRVMNRDPSLRGHPNDAWNASADESNYFFEHEGKVAILNFIEKAIAELNDVV